MPDFPETRDSLILLVKDASNQPAWEEFAAMYWPIVYRLARDRGLQEADAQDAAQRVLISVASSIGRWEPQGEQTRFRNWFARVAKNEVLKILSRVPRDAAVGGSAEQNLLEAQRDFDQVGARLEREHRREIYRRAAERVRHAVDPDTWQAFEMTVLQTRSIEATARQLGKSIGSVYACRSRVMRRLVEVARDLEGRE